MIPAHQISFFEEGRQMFDVEWARPDQTKPFLKSQKKKKARPNPRHSLYLLSPPVPPRCRAAMLRLRSCVFAQVLSSPSVSPLHRLLSAAAFLAFLAVHKFRQKSVVSKLHYYLRLLGTSHNLLRVMKFSNILSYNLERVVKPNLALLQGCGLGDCDIAKLCVSNPRLLTNNPKRVQAIVTCAQNIGGSRMFRHALHAVAIFREEEIAARMDYLRNTFRWTAAEVGMAVSKAPMVLTRAKESLQRTSEFLIFEVGLEPAYIARRPTLLTFSLKGRLRARHYVVKFLKENGLLGRNRDYYSIVNITEKVFVEKFICPHKEAAPHLAKDYAAACKDEVLTRFRFT